MYQFYFIRQNNSKQKTYQKKDNADTCRKANNLVHLCKRTDTQYDSGNPYSQMKYNTKIIKCSCTLLKKYFKSFSKKP